MLSLASEVSLSQRPHITAAQDFTLPFLISVSVLIFFGLFTIWVVWGLIAACAVGWLTDRCIIFGARIKNL